jgi:hypothetical protein
MGDFRLLAFIASIAAVAACTHDFDVFEPGASDGGATPADAGMGTDAGNTVDAGTTVDSGSTCTESGAQALDGHCYFLLGNRSSWDEAKDACAGARAHLVTIGSSAEQSLVQGISPNQDRWIGLRRPTGSDPGEASFTWVTGEARSFSQWDSGEPDGSGECVRMDRGPGRWSDAACSSSLQALCERD